MASQDKKLLIINILDILQKKTDANHRLTQKQIMDLLERDYNMVVNRKSVKRNLSELADFGYPVEHEEIRRGTDPDEDPICTNWYYNHKITDAELRLIIDSLLAAKFIPHGNCMQLIEKLKELSSEYFSHKVRHIAELHKRDSENKQLFYSIETIDEAIEKGKKVGFCYTTFGTDKQIHKKQNRTGQPIRYVVSPYQMAIANGRYYLICNTDGHTDLSVYRMERILQIELLDSEPIKPLREIPGYSNSLDLNSFMEEHLYMSSGESDLVSFRIAKSRLDDVNDWFDMASVRVSNEDKEAVTITARVNLKAMKYWAIQYCPYVEVISPVGLRNEIRQTLYRAAKKYNG